MNKVSSKLLGDVQAIAINQHLLGDQRLGRHYLSWYCAFRWVFLNNKIIELQDMLAAYEELQRECSSDMYNHIAYSQID